MKTKLVVDIQALQGVSKHRGIGRYTLDFCIAIAKYCNDLEIILVYNTALPVDDFIFSTLYKYYPAKNIVAYRNLSRTAHNINANSWRHTVTDVIFEYAIEYLKPDVVHHCSMFEGFVDDINIGLPSSRNYITTCTLYDLIPLANRHYYLIDKAIQKWYNDRLTKVLASDFIFAISQASCEELTKLTNFPNDRLMSIGGGFSDIFTDHTDQITGERMPNKNITHFGKFILYTGGIEYRKNIDNLIIAFAQIKQDIKLVIVCEIESHVRTKYLTMCQDLKIDAGRVVFTGYIDDATLRDLYVNCELFVFPSWHEGLGLPVLEAMACGAPVVASSIPSMKELIKNESALFDPYSPNDMAETIDRALNDRKFRQTQSLLAKHTLSQYTWERTATLFGKQIKRLINERGSLTNDDPADGTARQSLALISPWPPDETGIADYSQAAVKMLGKYYDITIFPENSQSEPALLADERHERDFHKLKQFDRRVYMLGGSLYHARMMKILQIYPGVVVAHDFFLGAFVAALDTLGVEPRLWLRALYESHGWAAISSWSREAAEVVAEKWPCNAFILRHANGVVVHSNHALSLAKFWLGIADPWHWRHVPFLARSHDLESKAVARLQLGIADRAMIFVTMGAVAATKNVIEILAAWEHVWRKTTRTMQLHIVGKIQSGKYGLRVKNEVARLRRLGAQVILFERVSAEEYRRHLAAADIAVQLRSRSRGETSAALFDCLTAGVPTIVNRHGSACEVAADAVLFIPDAFSISDLSGAMQALVEDAGMRQQLAKAAVDYVRNNHYVDIVGPKFRDAIEFFVKHGPRVNRLHVVDQLSSRAGIPSSVGEWQEVAVALGANEKNTILGVKRLYVELPSEYRELGTIKHGEENIIQVLKQSVNELIPGWRIEPVIAISIDIYQTASRLMLQVLGCDGELVEPVCIRRCDIEYVVQWPNEVSDWLDIKRWIQSREI